MSVPKEIQEKIDFLFRNNPEMREKLYMFDAGAVGEVGELSNDKIEPEDFIVAYESGDPDVMKYLYQQAKKLVGLKELYKELCFEYYKKLRDTSKHVEQSGSKRNGI